LVWHFGKRMWKWGLKRSNRNELETYDFGKEVL